MRRKVSTVALTGRLLGGGGGGGARGPELAGWLARPQQIDTNPFLLGEEGFSCAIAPLLSRSLSLSLSFPLSLHIYIYFCIMVALSGLDEVRFGPARNAMPSQTPRYVRLDEPIARISGQPWPAEREKREETKRERERASNSSVGNLLRKEAYDFFSAVRK